MGEKKFVVVLEYVLSEEALEGAVENPYLEIVRRILTSLDTTVEPHLHMAIEETAESILGILKKNQEEHGVETYDVVIANHEGGGTILESKKRGCEKHCGASDCTDHGCQEE